MSVTKRTCAPVFWPIEIKTKKFVISPKPGPHSKHECIPLSLILRDILKYAKTGNESKVIVKKRLVSIDGRVVREPGFPVGLMDVLTVGNENYRIIPNNKGLYLQKITDDEAEIKLLKITNKTCFGNRMQLNMHDGSNMLVNGNEYKTGDTIVFDIKDRKIKDVFRYEKGSIGIVTRGKRIGSVGRVEKVIITKSSRPNEVIMRISDRLVTLPRDYVFIIGSDKPAIVLGD
jgi:small subunit ribosomal protein S4e